MTLSANQCFFVLLLVAAARGYSRGWHREIITCAVTLGGVLFLTVGGGNALAQLLGSVPNALPGGSGLNFNVNTAPSNPVFNFLLLAAFAVIGHFAGGSYGAAPKSAQHRLGGLAAGIVTGLAVVYYITRQILPSTTFDATSPSSALVTSWLIGLFGVGVMLMLLLALIRK